MDAISATINNGWWTRWLNSLPRLWLDELRRRQQPVVVMEERVPPPLPANCMILFIAQSLSAMKDAGAACTEKCRERRVTGKAAV